MAANTSRAAGGAGRDQRDRPGKQDAEVQQLAHCAASYPKYSDPYDICIHLATASDDELTKIAYSHAQDCAVIYPTGRPAFKNCAADALSPS